MIIAWAKKQLEKGHERTIKARKNVLMAVLYKAIGVLIGFAYFPISLAYLGQARFGIFLTLVSIVDWFADFDIGIGNGLRNRLGEAISDGNTRLARGYVSTAYFIVGAIFSGIAVVGMAMSFVFPWADWLNADPSLSNEIMLLAVLLFAAFAVNFISSLVYQIFFALQQTAVVDFFNLLSKALFLIVILLIFFSTESSLVLYGGAKTFTFALIPLGVGLYYFKGKLKQYRPSYKLVKREYFRSLFSLGFQFFLIKMAMIIIHSTNNILIATYVSPDEVAEYEAAFKYFSIFLMLFVILNNQYWVASIEAYRKGDLAWMKETIFTIIKIWCGTILLTLVMIMVAPFFYKLWLQDKMVITTTMTLSVALTITLSNWVNMFNTILNGTGKVRIQMIAWVGASVLNIPVSIFMATTLGWGSVGIVLGTAVCMIPLVVLSPWQVFKILNQKERGIWAK